MTVEVEEKITTNKNRETSVEGTAMVSAFLFALFTYTMMVVMNEERKKKLKLEGDIVTAESDLQCNIVNPAGNWKYATV